MQRRKKFKLKNRTKKNNKMKKRQMKKVKIINLR